MNPLQLTQEDIPHIFKLIGGHGTASKLGFFSSPFKVNFKGKELIIKTYLPSNDSAFLRALADHHDRYVAKMLQLGIKIPETKIVMRPLGKKIQLVLVQEAFEEKELIRYQMENAAPQAYWPLVKLLLDDAVKFWVNKDGDPQIGFHPTSRNYAYRKGTLYYFDTFPPMLTDQSSLNKLIVQMAPNFQWLKSLIPSSLINIVSDEYYQLDKMLIGIIGSACRLRPELRDDVMGFAVHYLENNSELEKGDRKALLAMLQKPPKLPGIWVLVRKLTGNVGRPNI